MASEEFVLGERVRFDAKLVRKKEYHPRKQVARRGEPKPEGLFDEVFKSNAYSEPDSERYHEHETRRWETEDQPMREGVLVGIRTLKNGNAVYFGPEEGIEFRETESVRAALVAWSLSRVPTIVPLDRLHRNV